MKKKEKNPTYKKVTFKQFCGHCFDHGYDYGRVGEDGTEYPEVCLLNEDKGKVIPAKASTCPIWKKLPRAR